ncbi:MAG TPA: CoA transferase, partial [Acidimicrobiales bacterium]|nr:CoA transferase [Acidimicrobiales bacterium]
PPGPHRATGEGPLAGLRVVEATTRIQGPFAGMLLRMLGADVVRVQPPEGDYGRAALCLHRGKETVRLDLGTAPGRRDLAALVDGADVFFHNWRPGKAAEWGLDAAALAGRNPRLVYGSASGWGDRPVGRSLVGTDFLVQAYAGLGHALHPEGEPPYPSRVILGDLFGALVLAEGLVAGLYRREHEPGAWEVRSSLLAGVMTLQAHVLDAVAAGKSDGRPRWGPLDRPLATAEGTLVVSADDDGAFHALCRACGVEPTGSSRAATEARLAAVLAGDRAWRWAGELAAAGVPCAVACEDLAAVPADPRFTARFEPVGTGGVAHRSPWAFR